MAVSDNISDRIARAVAAAEETQRARANQPRADRAYLVRDAAKRYGLGEEDAARITGSGATEIQREARALALERSRLAAAEADVGRTADD
ncbi:hypothetical protein ONA91_04465 [Micromonospora sp. DR5-3]|uniref:hypothetical protein n=1 Tax=unclassified Micromonospora TaxID=2617518 RepID=UPI0011D5FF11|nr:MULTISPECIES: hypothetical protein [unclassified Micromonospora]MCW3813712.1 hypothetical protein [Micromonospora sp. DR5-3]TYC25596.1 hypothetical protein FXF52_04025 [Micromonospora sp. MP36]